MDANQQPPVRRWLLRFTLLGNLGSMGTTISLFTPTHNPRYLPDVHAAIRQQQYDNWEWVIVANGPAVTHLKASRLPADKRIRLLTAPEACGGRIGALKRYACSQSRGDVLLEMDHDDLLVPGTLPKVAQAYENGAGFIYSDVAVFEKDYKSWAYSKQHQWEHYPITVYGRRYIVTKCFPLSPRMLCEVYYAPDHLRAWSRQVYEQAGGHDETMKVGDDHDLVCRTYLTGTTFAHIGGCGYLYRWHPDNTIKSTQKDIVAQVRANKLRHMTPLIREWCRREGHETLDLLSLRQGNFRRTDCLELLKRFAVDKEGFDKPIGHIIASDVLQFETGENLIEFFNEAYSKLVPGGWLSVVVPSERGLYARQNPLHKTIFNLNSFHYYSDKRFAATLPEVTCRYDLAVLDEFYPDDHFKQYGMLMLRAELCALKGQPHPGKPKI